MVYAPAGYSGTWSQSGQVTLSRELRNSRRNWVPFGGVHYKKVSKSE